MKRFILVLFLCNIHTLDTEAQNNNPGALPVAVPVAQGIWVYLGNKFPKNMHYQVERSKGNNRFKKIADVVAPASILEMTTRQQSHIKYFEKLDPLKDEEIKRLWQTVQNYSVADSLFSNNLPMMHLMAGTAYFDATAERNVSYVYKINLLDSDGKIISSKESNPSASIKRAELPLIKFLDRKFADGKLALTWSVMDPMKMSHFNIYRSVFVKEEYKKIAIEKGGYTQNENLVLLAIDTIGKNPAWYEYEIAAVDAYGNEGEKQGHASGGNVEDYYAPPVTNFNAVNKGKNHEIKLSWRFENKKYLNGVSIMRSTQYDSGYKRIVTLPVNETEYTDIIPVSGENYYYYLLLHSANADPIPTTKIFATYGGVAEKPNPPTEIDASTILNGIKVFWKSEEPYVKGFYVYRRSNSFESFKQVSSLIIAGAITYSFADTSLQLRSGEVYEYTVRTINEDNLLSSASDTVSANPGVKMKIAAPVNLRYRLNDRQITIIWEDMSKWVNDLLGYKVFRKAGTGNFIRMANDSLQPERNFFLDSTIQPGVDYSFAVSSLDISGNESEKSIILIPAISDESPGAPSGIRVSQTENDVYITWGQITEDVTAIKIYRSEPGVPAKLIATISDADSFTDKNVSKEKLYFYQLASVSKANIEGVKSEKISVRL